MSYSKILIYSDDIAQANRLGLLLSRYGHEPYLVKQIDPMHPPGGLHGAMFDCRRLPAEWRLIATTLASQGLPVVLFMENLPENQQQLLLEAGVTLVRKCLAEAKKRFVANLSSWHVVIIDKNGHRVLENFAV